MVWRLPLKGLAFAVYVIREGSTTPCTGATYLFS